MKKVTWNVVLSMFSIVEYYVIDTHLYDINNTWDLSWFEYLTTHFSETVQSTEKFINRQKM